MNPDNLTEVTATIDACNRANVAIYPIDVRGLVASGVAMMGPGLPGLAALQAALLTGPLAFQGRGGTSGGGGTTGGSTSGTTPPRGGTSGGTVGGGSRGGTGTPAPSSPVRGASPGATGTSKGERHTHGCRLHAGAVLLRFALQARVDIALDIPAGPWKFGKEKGKSHSTLNIVGIACFTDGSGSVGARFSDAVNMTFDDKKQVEEFEAKPFHYEKQFEMASGDYNLRVVFSSGADSFGKVEMPLALDPWDTNQFALSGLAFSTEAHPAADLNSSVDAGLMEDRVPLIFGGLEITPAGSNRFRKNLRRWAFRCNFWTLRPARWRRILESTRVPTPPATGNPVVPLALRLPIGEMPLGAYQLKVTGLDETGHQSTRTANLEIVQ
jgi:hypothetical protein